MPAVYLISNEIYEVHSRNPLKIVMLDTFTHKDNIFIRQGAVKHLPRHSPLGDALPFPRGMSLNRLPSARSFRGRAFIFLRKRKKCLHT